MSSYWNRVDLYSNITSIMIRENTDKGTQHREKAVNKGGREVI